jgi:cytochrome c-type biogenesis protein
MVDKVETGFFLSFLAGMASLISPCVLPIIPLLISHSLLKKSIGNVILFSLGFFLFFAILTTLTVVFTASINYYLYYFRIGAALILIVVGIFFIFNKKFSSFSKTPKTGKGLIGSFLFGFFTCMAWSPCFGPYIFAVAVYSLSTGNIVYSAINMVLFAGGFSFTIFILALLSSKLDFQTLLKYSDWIRILSGLIIAIAGFYMLWILII